MFYSGPFWPPLPFGMIPPTSYALQHMVSYYPTEEENREALRRMGEWWRWKRYYDRFDRCCHK